MHLVGGGSRLLDVVDLIKLLDSELVVARPACQFLSVRAKLKRCTAAWTLIISYFH